MLANLMKRVAIAALLVTLFVSISTQFQPVLSTIICAGACVAWYEALRARESSWALLFAAVALILNPVVPLRLPYTYSLLLSFLCLSLFISSLVQSKQISLIPLATETRG